MNGIGENVYRLEKLKRKVIRAMIVPVNEINMKACDKSNEHV
jgi:hypothetical protein